MRESELTTLEITALAELLSRKRVSPVEVVQAYLERIDRQDCRLNAYISVHPESALATARQAAKEILAGRYRGPLHGVPVAVKDLFLVEGMERTCGSSIMKGEIAERDASSVARLKTAGAVMLGTLNLHEFAYGPTGINPHHGTARNPWNADMVCGGSSSGSGCAVAGSLAAGALGTDTGGSIRIPASLCGVVGLKQTYGLASRHGIYPLCEDFDHGGPLARTISDAALLLQAIAGEDANDPSTRFARVADYSAKLGQDVRGVRVGVPREYFFDALHHEVEASVQAALSLLQDLGAVVDAISVPFAAQAADAWNTIALAEAYLVHEQHLIDRGDELSPDVKARLLLGKGISTKELVHARWARTAAIREMTRLLETVDLLAVPSTPIPAVPVETGTMLVGAQPVKGATVLGRLTRLAALTGQPAVSIPCGLTSDGLPIGLQLIGRWYAEAELLQVGYAYEQAAGWHRRQPPEFHAKTEPDDGRGICRQQE